MQVPFQGRAGAKPLCLWYRIIDEFHGRRWMPLQPKVLSFEKSQILLIGNADEGLEKATAQQPEDEKQDKDAPLEEMEKLEHEDELRIQHLKGTWLSPILITRDQSFCWAS